MIKLKPSASGLNGFSPHSPLLEFASNLTSSRLTRYRLVVAMCDSRKYISHRFQFSHCRFVYIHTFDSENVYYLRFAVVAKQPEIEIEREKERGGVRNVRKNETKTTRKSTNFMTSFICRRPFVLCFLLLIFAVSHARAHLRIRADNI